MAEPWEWERNDLQALVDQQATEGLTLEFKACAALDKSDKNKNELSKDVSAFANAAGGTIVYGIVEEKQVAEGLDAGFDSNDISREWIEQVIHSRIQPPISGVRVKPIPLSSERAGKFAYVVYVPQSSTAHQAFDKKYYRRHGSRSVPMEDYEIRDVMRRTGAPRLGIEVEVDGKSEGEANFPSISDDLIESPKIDIFARNDPAAGTAPYSQHQIFFHSRFQLNLQESSRPQYQSATKASIDNYYLEYVHYDFSFSPNHMPWFPNERRWLQTLTLRFPASWAWQREYPYPWILWRIRAANANPRVGAVVFQSVLSDYWRFRPATIDELEDIGYTVEFAP